jgi:hypothetical protein
VSELILAKAFGLARASHVFAEVDGVVHERDRMMHISIIPPTRLNDKYFDHEVEADK